MAPEYNVDFVVCIGRSVIDICQTATILKNERMIPLDKPQDIDNYVAQLDQHQRIIYTQLKYDIGDVNDKKQMPHAIIVQTKLVGARHNTQFYTLQRNRTCTLTHSRITPDCCI